MFSPDGKYLYFSGMNGRFNYNVDLGKWQVHRLNRETGEIDALTSEYGGGTAPGDFSGRAATTLREQRDAITGLRARDLDTRAERWLTAA